MLSRCAGAAEICWLSSASEATSSTSSCCQAGAAEKVLLLLCCFLGWEAHTGDLWDCLPVNTYIALLF